MSLPDYDLCIIGGGINGAGIARDAAGRGLSVLLLEAGDLASATSSASTKLIHGGLRYLEYYEFGLVRESLKERERLLHIAPHMVHPMEFVLPHDMAQRPRWMIRAGLFLYDRLGGRKSVKSSRGIKLRGAPYGTELQSRFSRGFRYYDCWTDDSRLTVLNAMDAARNGADILTRTACTKIAAEADGWRVTMRDLETGREREIKSGMLVNAGGPWVRSIIESSGFAASDVPAVRLVKGSHIIIPRAYEGDHAYILQQPDRRIVFTIPYERAYTLVGTTEVDHAGNPSAAVISDFEIDYLCASFNRTFKNRIDKEDILWTYSGVRPLFDDGKGDATSVTRDYRIYHHSEFPKPFLSIFGGKLTTYRMLAEKTVTKLLELSGHTTLPWTHDEPLPGGNIPDGDFDAFVDAQMMRYSWLPLDLVRRYARSYGTFMDRFLDGSSRLEDMGRHFGNQVYEAEIVYLVKMEWARTVEDILWRRSKLGMHVDDETIRNLERALPGLVNGGGRNESIAGD